MFSTYKNNHKIILYIFVTWYNINSHLAKVEPKTKNVPWKKKLKNIYLGVDWTNLNSLRK